ncbi:type I-E CRISPR-associated endoribonuclease Cas2 [Romeria aff. gracilis LEGE 07310]|uniref:Type I-E CRISPR-associated endoribonuclease Cas2 n=1 Tax=Vasconcelosia minhoensis LEGE 07310 TaxID=915328 RepID=A0A8J7AI43_9CYAN|nr:type I-E CRISPR-associated endoribonuclease Cas2e [Romeria gracilis]MBE9077998.1 type I-E CRISPR-associated endoribonuclease Cas2 [Romeria aff. gracilis LEGE 07310]
MVVFILENAKPALRGELSRWLFEIKAGVFAGRISALVRDELWELIEQKLGKGSAVMLYSQRNEQGFDARMLGNPSRALVDIEGVLLVKVQ